MGRLRVGAVLVGLLMGGPALGAGLGFGGDVPPARIPIPARDFSAVVEDQTGVTVDVTQVSYNGEVYLYGLYGAGQVTIPFEKIREIRFEPSNEKGKRVAFATLRDASSVRVVIDDDVPAYGKTAFGTYQITVDRVRRMTFGSP